MGYYITNECINCGACVLECPEDAIYEPNKKYKFEGKTHDAISSVHYYIAPFICDECENFTVPKCSAVCPMDSIKKNNE